MFAQQGHSVKCISATDGSAGHHTLSGSALIARRAQEVQAAAHILGVTYEILPLGDGQLMPTLENRMLIIRKIREWQADIVITHRPNDYHPDHRYLSRLVQDAAYMIMVPHVASQTPPLRKNPLFLYFADRFQKPNPFSPDIAVDIDEVYQQKIQAIHAHQSQFYEWIPWIEHHQEEVPATDEARQAWLQQRWTFPVSPRMRHSLEKWYGPDKAARVQHAEAFEICEYGHQPTEEDIRRLFPIMGAV